MSFYRVSNLVGNGLILLGTGLCASALLLFISTSANAQQGTRDILREEVNPKQDEADPWLGGVWQFGA